MCCFRLLHETISLQFGYKDSANRRQYTICKDKNCKLQPYLTFIFIVEMQPILSKDRNEKRATPWHHSRRKCPPLISDVGSYLV